MSKIITSTQIGTLTQNAEFEDWYESEPFVIPFLNNEKLQIVYEFDAEKDAAFIKEADAAIQNFLQLDNANKLNVSDLVYKNCKDFLNDIGYDELNKKLWEITDTKEIWTYVQPDKITVKRSAYDDKAIYILILCECAWEQEHGWQLLFKNGEKLDRVSDQDFNLTVKFPHEIENELIIANSKLKLEYGEFNEMRMGGPNCATCDFINGDFKERLSVIAFDKGIINHSIAVVAVAEFFSEDNASGSRCIVVFAEPFKIIRLPNKYPGSIEFTRIDQYHLHLRYYEFIGSEGVWKMDIIEHTSI